VKYSLDIKAVAVKLMIQGKSPQTINKVLEMNISNESLQK
jgi:hypothetical protein